MALLPEGEFLLPLFPLPNIVFFPHTRLPLHVFEPRYRQMVSDCLETDQRFGIVLLRPGWESDYFGAPPVFPYGTLGTIETAVPIEDGRYNIVVRGDVRFRIIDEVSRVPYRTARVIAEPETERDPHDSYARREWLADLSHQYLRYLPDQTAVPEIATVDLDALANALIMSLNLNIEEKQRLLEMNDVMARAEEVGTELSSRIESLRFLAPFRRGTDPSHN
jgi:Lon protease-like protein